MSRWGQRHKRPGGTSSPEDTHKTSSLALELDHVTVGYGAAPVLRDVSISVPTGQVVALLGPNGAGKTTTLKVACGLLRPSAGTIRINGQDVTQEAMHERARRGLCDIPEGRSIFPSLTVRDNLVLHSARHRENEDVARAVAIFPALGSRLRQIAGSLSGGEQQMLAISRAFIANPTVVTVDEVSLGLAPIILEQIFGSLAALAETGAALLIVEQYVDRALELAQQVYVLSRGALVFSGPSAEINRQEIFEKYLLIDVGT